MLARCQSKVKSCTSPYLCSNLIAGLKFVLIDAARACQARTPFFSIKRHLLFTFFSSTTTLQQQHLLPLFTFSYLDSSYTKVSFRYLRTCARGSRSATLIATSKSQLYFRHFRVPAVYASLLPHCAAPCPISISVASTYPVFGTSSSGHHLPFINRRRKALPRHWI